MSKISDYRIEKFVSLKDTPNEYVPGKYVTVEADGIDYGDVDTSTSGVSGGGLNYNYYFDTSTSGTLASGIIRLNSDNYPAVSKIDISYYDKDGNDLSDWINSWDDSDKSIKGTLTLQSATKVNKYAMFKLTETLDTTFGSGKDGDVTISGSVNLNTTAIADGRTYPDMVAYSVSSVGANSCQTTETPNGIEAGDAVLLINLQGSSNTQVDNVGNFEVFIVDNIVSTTVVFKSSKSKYYGNNGGDTNIGTATTNQRVMLMRIPQYNVLTLNSGASITCNAWNDKKYGVVAVMCKTSADIIGDINVNGKGYKAPGTMWYAGESYGGGPVRDARPNLGGGGVGQPGHPEGGGGSYGTRGVSTQYASAGYTYGSVELDKVYFGSGGGDTPGGGDGGGINLMFIKELNIYGNVYCKGLSGGAGGSGGSVLIKTNRLSMNSGHITSIGGSGSDNHHGSGGAGRIAIYYNALMDSLSNVNPTPYTDSLTSGADQIEYNLDWLNNSGKFDDNEEVIVSYAYNY